MVSRKTTIAAVSCALAVSCQHHRKTENIPPVTKPPAVQVQDLGQLPDPIASQKWRVIRLSRTEKENRDKSTFVVNFYFLGTGVALVRGKQTYVITNKHIVEKVEDVTRIYADFPPPIGAHPVNWSRKSFSGDIAVLATELKIDGETQEQIGEAKPSTPVFVVGFDDEHIDNLSMQRGAIEMLGAWVEDKHMLIPSGIYFGPSVPAMIISGVTCRAGGSGSPVFSLDGKILGIVKGFTDDRKCLAIRIGAALELLEPEKY